MRDRGRKIKQIAPAAQLVVVQLVYIQRLEKCSDSQVHGKTRAVFLWHIYNQSFRAKAKAPAAPAWAQPPVLVCN